MWPSRGHPSAFLHISCSILPPYSITLCTSPIANHPLPPSHVLPELLPSLPTNSLFIQCKLLHSFQTFIMLYALVQLPTSSFCNPPFLCTYHCTLGSHAVPLHDGLHLTLTYEYCFRTAPFPLDMVPGRFYSGVHSPFWYSFHSHFHI